jgi:hypothetical protein
MRPFEIMQQWEPKPGNIAGGYKLLRSEYRADKRDGQDESKPYQWLGALERVLRYGTDPSWNPRVHDPWHWLSPQIAVYDLFMNGDIMQEDMELFALVLRRYINLKETS